MKEKRKYESPLMERTLVELEDGFCAASVEIEPAEGEKIGEIEKHQVNDGFQGGDFSSQPW